MARHFSGARLRHHRQQAGLRREVVAVAIDRSIYSVNAYEAGTVDPPAGIVAALAAVLHVDLDDLFTEDREAVEA